MSVMDDEDDDNDEKSRRFIYMLKSSYFINRDYYTSLFLYNNIRKKTMMLKESIYCKIMIIIR